jgi:hypothetical protein
MVISDTPLDAGDPGDTARFIAQFGFAMEC